MSLEQCLAKSESTTVLKDQNAYYCSNCKDHNQATKQMTIFKTPAILILTLQRFKNGHKNQDLVEFPIVGLEMNKFMASKTANLVYDLYGVVYHGGTLNFGHYTAKCFNEATGKWHSYNDSSVSDID